jgi:flagellar hook-length control protein FliK
METNSLGIQNLLNILTKSKTTNKTLKTMDSNPTLLSFKSTLESFLISKKIPYTQKPTEPQDKNSKLEKLNQESEILSYLNISLLFDNPKIQLETNKDTSYIKISDAANKKTITFEVNELINHFNNYIKQKQNTTYSNNVTETTIIKDALKIIHNIQENKELTNEDVQILLKAIDITTKNVIQAARESLTNTGTILPQQKMYIESLGIKIDVISIPATKNEDMNLITIQKGNETIIIPENQPLSDEKILNNIVLIKINNNYESDVDNINNLSEFIYSNNNYTTLTNINPDILSFELSNSTLPNTPEITKTIIFLPETAYNSSNDTLKNIIISLMQNQDDIAKSENKEIFEKNFPIENVNNILVNKKDSSSQNNNAKNFNENDNKFYIDIQKERKENYLTIEDFKNELQTKKVNSSDMEDSDMLQASKNSTYNHTNTSYDITNNLINIDNQTNQQFESLTNIHQKNDLFSFFNTDDLNAQIKDVIVRKNTEQFFNESFSVNVSPPNLGKVDIQIIKNGEAITINLATESENAKSTISKTVQSLVGNLRDEGYNPVDVKIIIHQDENYMDYQKQQNQDQPQQEPKRYKQEEEQDKPPYTFEEFLRSDLNA